MLPQIKVYISAKLVHAHKLAALKADGFHINARWIEMSEAGRQKLKPVSHWQQENFDDIEMADVFILYVEPSDDLKGSIFEIGHAVRAGKLCWIVGNAVSDGQGGYSGQVEVALDGTPNSILMPNKYVTPWGLYRQRIKMLPNLEEAFKDIRAVLRQTRNMRSDGSVIPPAEF